ncbi:uncharacterized protein [Euwallacea similis]|uniref:uncharacterized protein n=1 Tax=Euwallacea similis TaxID=1736056 RepID=UPI00344EBF6A
MKATLLNTAFVLIIILNVHNQVLARPNLNSRVKRISSTSFDDVRTRNELAQMKGYAITLPVGGGIHDIERIGRKRRSQSRFLEALFNHSEEDQGDPRDDRNNLPELVFDYK